MPEADQLNRSFIAIPLSSGLKQEVSALQRQFRQLLPELKPANIETLHLTLHFLGDLSQLQLAEVGQVMLSIGQKKKNFNVVVEGLSFFPNRRRPKIVWLGMAPVDDLKNLHGLLVKELKKIGLAVDPRPFKPHLTIGRFRQQPPSAEPLCPFLSHCCGSMKIDRMVLYTSRLTSQGAIHTPVTEAKLLLAT